MPTLTEILDVDQERFLREYNSRNPVLAAARVGVDLIRERTRRGLDKDGKPFKPYARSTMRMKVRTGRQVTPVNLTQTGSMLNSLVAQTGRFYGGEYWGHRTRVEITATGGMNPVGGMVTDQQKLRWHTTGTRRGLPRRDILGFTPAELEVVSSVHRVETDRCIPKNTTRRVTLRFFQ